MKRQRNSYTVKEKRQVVQMAHRMSNKCAAQHFSLDQTMVGQWVRQFSKDREKPLSKNTRSIGSGRHAFFPEEEAQLYQWIMMFREDGLAVTYVNIKLKMAEIMKESAKQTQDETKKLAITNFKCSAHWLARFLKRHDLSLRRKTKISQKLPRDLEEKLLNFQQFVICLCQKNSYPLNIIINMNETLVWFE